MTHFVLLALGAVIVVLTIVSCFGWLPSLRIVPDNTHFDFTRFRRISFPISAALSIVAITLFFTHGLNFGIDFKGGTLLEVRAKSGTADLAAMRASLGSLGLGDIQMQQFGGPDEVLIRVAEQPGGDAAQQGAVQKVRGALGDSVDYRRVEVVGPRVSGELLAYGMIGLMLAIFSILIYLWFRFEWQFALGAMIANVHDIVLTIGFMSISQVDFDLTSIAALLTILGYSLNDTVVIYDRIREMLRRYKKMPMPELLNEFDQFDAVALDHHPRHGNSGAIGAASVRRQRDPQLYRCDDVRRGAGRHLYFDLHRRADPDLSGCRRSSRRSPGRADEEEVAMADRPDAPHLPRAAPIEAYGKGGFAFDDMSHRGSLLCLPDGIWAWPVTRPEADRPLFAGADFRGGQQHRYPDRRHRHRCLARLRRRCARRLRAVRVVLDAMQTGPAIRTYNIMLGERRRVAAALIAVP